MTLGVGTIWGFRGTISMFAKNVITSGGGTMAPWTEANIKIGVKKDVITTDSMDWII